MFTDSHTTGKTRHLYTITEVSSKSHYIWVNYNETESHCALHGTEWGEHKKFKWSIILQVCVWLQWVSTAERVETKGRVKGKISF